MGRGGLGVACTPGLGRDEWKGRKRRAEALVFVCVHLCKVPVEGKPGLLKFCLSQPETNSLRTYWAWRAVCVCAQCFKHGCFCFVDVLGAVAGVLGGGQRQTNPVLTFHSLESEVGCAGRLPIAAGRSLGGLNTCKVEVLLPPWGRLGVVAHCATGH